MPTFVIHELPGDLLEALESRAALNSRSIEDEVRQILTNALEAKPGLRLHLSKVASESNWSREEIYGDDAR